MDIPRYWAEHREQRQSPQRKQITLRRFGWSNDSLGAAETHARARVAAALAEVDAGRQPTRRERKVAYGGGDGLPIREEIVAEYADVGAVVTRNGYGARCLNVPDVLIADIDTGEAAAERARMGVTLTVTLIMGGIAGLGAVGAGGLLRMLLFLVLVLILGFGAAAWLRARRAWQRAVTPGRALEPVRAWVAAHPDWIVHVYRTPAGYRLFATHAPQDPVSAEVTAFFTAIGADPLYVRMCAVQACFRARLTAKPWRIGITDRIGWGTWPPISERARHRRTTWIAAYEAIANGYAPCTRDGIIGTAPEHPHCRAVRDLHDRLCLLDRALPLA